MYRISVTTLEKFRRFINDVSSFDSEEALLASIKGIFTGNAKTDFGGAYHKVIEGDFKQVMNKPVYQADVFIFTKEQVAPALEYSRMHPSMTHEMDVRKVYQAHRFPIQVSGRVDAVEGLAIRDAKTKFRSPNYQEYIESCQWKFYLDMLQTDVFYYDIFEVKGFGDAFNALTLYPDITITAHPPLQCYRYRSMESDILTILNDFLDYVANRDLFSYLKPAIEEEPLFI